MSEEEPLLAPEALPQNEPVPLRRLLTRDVLVASGNYAFVALLEISFRVLQPVFLSTPIELGGLGLDPPAIGGIVSLIGILDGFINIIAFAPLVNYFGPKKVHIAGIAAAIPCFISFPIISYLARKSVERSGSLGTEVWLVVGFQVMMSVVACMSYGKFIPNGWAHCRTDLVVACKLQAQYLCLSPRPHQTELR